MDFHERMKTLSRTDFAALGVDAVAFVKQVVVDEQTGFAICAADGRALAVVPNWDVAIATIRDNDLEPVALH